MLSLSEKRAKTNRISTSLDATNSSEFASKIVLSMPTSISEQEKSMITKFCKLGGASRKSVITVPSEEERRNLSIRPNADGLRINIKRSRSKSVADPPSTNRTYSIAKSKINFRSAQNPCIHSKTDETKLLGTSSKLHPIVQASIVLEKKEKNRKYRTGDSKAAISLNSDCIDEDTNTEIKKQSISLDMLVSNSKGRSKHCGSDHTPQNTPASSEDNLISSTRSNQSSTASSPKTRKKKSETSRNLLFSLLRRSPNVKESGDARQSSL